MSKIKQFAVIAVPYAVLSVVFSWLVVSVLVDVLVEYAAGLAAIVHAGCTIAFLVWLKRRNRSFAWTCVCVLGLLWPALVYALTASLLHH